MKRVIIEENLFNDVINITSNCDSFCAVIKCSVFKLHENSELYACLRSAEGTPCNLYIAESAESIKKRREGINEKEWIEAIGKSELDSIIYYRLTQSKAVESSEVICGIKMHTIDKSLCQTMNRLSTDANHVQIICHRKKYSKEDKDAFQKRSVIDLSSVDSRGVDIVYFDGADKLIEKLMYGGCRELTVFINEYRESKDILRRLEKISQKAPFSNRLTVVTGDSYLSRTEPFLIVGRSKDISSESASKIFISSAYVEGEGILVFVGQNVENMLPVYEDCRIKSHTLHYVTSIMSELILHAITTKEYSAKRLFKVNAKNLTTETIIKED